MHKLLYVSLAKRDFPKHKLEEILMASRANNLARGVTGLLLYADGGFLQVLEGEAETIQSLYQHIEKDVRHWDAKVLLNEQSERNFGEWSMGFASVDERSHPGLVGLTNSAINGLIRPGGAKPILDILISTFRAVQNIA